MGRWLGCCRPGVDRSSCLVVAGPPVLKIGATGRRADDVRVLLGVELEGPGMASLQLASICWLISCSGTGREHIGLWVVKATPTENHKEPERWEGALPSDCINCNLYFNDDSTENTGLASPVLELAIVLADCETRRKVVQYTQAAASRSPSSARAPQV